MKTSELTGQELDRAVHFLLHPNEPIKDGCTAPPYSSDWCFGGPIVVRERIELEHDGAAWWARIKADEDYTGPTPLIAAMRAYVASKMGDEIEMPEELKC